MTYHRGVFHLLSFSIILVALTGCGASQNEELNQWMAEQKASVKPGVKPISEPKKYFPQAYAMEAAADPFSNQRLISLLRKESNVTGASSALIAPEMTRRKDPLEAYPLDAIQMVGSLSRNNELVGLVRVNNLLYQVKSGQYLGQNYGRITKISEDQINVRELIQDAAGEWTERTAALQLQEKAK